MFSESFAESWRLRYGHDPAQTNDDLAPFLRHRSIRKFKDQAVDESLVSALIACAQSASTSSTLQLWSAVSVQNQETREEIAKHAENYEHIKKAGWFFVFLADHYRLQQAALKIGEKGEGLEFTEFYTMAVVDAALAAERMATAAETIGLGICYIGAIRNNPPEIKRILKLPDHTFALFGFCLGWPEEPIKSQVKPRLSQPAIWHREIYNAQPPIEEYDQRMSDFYEKEKMKGDVTWSMRSGRRVDLHHMTGRETQKDWIEGQGFAKK